MTTPIRNIELTPDEAITLSMDVAYASGVLRATQGGTAQRSAGELEAHCRMLAERIGKSIDCSTCRAIATEEGKAVKS